MPPFVVSPTQRGWSANGCGEGPPRGPSPACWLGRLGEVGEVAGLELHQRVALDLPDALARDAEAAADLLERGRRAVVVEPVAELDDGPLAIRELREHPAHGLRPHRGVGVLVRAGRLHGEQLAELGTFAVLTDLLVEARDDPRRLPDLLHLVERQLGLLRDLL